MSYRVIVERDETGTWIARVPAVRGCHTHGRTLRQVRSRIREALSLWIDDADAVELDFEIRLPTDARQALRQATEARRRNLDTERAAAVATLEAAEALTSEHGLSLRDAAELLGISHQRVQQLLAARRAAS